MTKHSGPYTLAYKSSRSPMVTFRPAFWKVLLAAEPEEGTLAWAKLRRDLKVFYPDVRLNPEQQQEWNQRIGVNEQGLWTSRYSRVDARWFRILRAYTDGLMDSAETDIETNLADIAAFYALVRQGMGSGIISSASSSSSIHV